MTVMDFESIYPSLNLSATCLLFYWFLIKDTQDEDQDPVIHRDLTHLICNDSFFEFRSLYYRQIQRVPIGSIMAGVLAKIVVREVKYQIEKLSPPIC